MSAELVRYSVSDKYRGDHARSPAGQCAEHAADRCAAGGAWRRPKDDPAVSAVIIGSLHKVFCAGLDLDIVRGKPGIETKKFLERLYFALNDTQYRMGKPTIAAVDGAVRAGGMTIAISCDMIIAGDASYLRLSRDRCRADPGDPFRAVAAAGRQASGVWAAVPRRTLRCRDRLSHGAAERGRPPGNRARPRPRDCAKTRDQVDRSS